MKRNREQSAAFLESKGKDPPSKSNRRQTWISLEYPEEDGSDFIRSCEVRTFHRSL
ncbi:MAG TPA: hypothetical protein VHX68_17155 [Planctomycetaceae bacterium]|nr:hypothetical protein [Planctomycetaceae bacterium]